MLTDNPESPASIEHLDNCRLQMFEGGAQRGVWQSSMRSNSLCDGVSGILKDTLNYALLLKGLHGG